MVAATVDLKGTIAGARRALRSRTRVGARQRGARSVHHRPARPRHGPRAKAACAGARPTSPCSRRWVRRVNGERQRTPGARRSRAVEPDLQRVADAARRHRAAPRPDARRAGARRRHRSPATAPTSASKGTAVFSGLKVDDTFDALTLNAAFDAHVPNLEFPALTAERRDRRHARHRGRPGDSQPAGRRSPTPRTASDSRPPPTRPAARSPPPATWRCSKAAAR